MLTLKQFKKAVKTADDIMFAIQISENGLNTFYVKLSEQELDAFTNYIDHFGKNKILATMAPNNVLYVGE